MKFNLIRNVFASRAALQVGFVLRVSLAGLGVQAGGVTRGLDREADRPSPCGGSGDVPTPFLNTNQKVELSDGELYTLVGKVRSARDGFYFEVDLGEHPWLASARRRASPLYGLEGSPSFWRRFDGRKVRLQVEAKGAVRVDSGTGEAEYWISLQPLADPVLMQGRTSLRLADPR